MKHLTFWRSAALALTLAATSACSADTADSQSQSQPQSADVAEAATPAQVNSLVVHKSPTCGCCGAWVDHMHESGFQTKVEDTQNLGAIKQQYEIEPRFQSCHTAVTQDGSYFFEGHIPAKLIEQFLADPPQGAAGLAVPGMPAGSPGMEMGDRFNAYDVLQINEDGSTEVYASMDTAAEQF